MGVVIGLEGFIGRELQHESGRRLECRVQHTLGWRARRLGFRAQAQLLGSPTLVLCGITHKLNADWRAMYRACFVLSEVYRTVGRDDEADRCRHLCAIANPHFPFEALAH